MGGGSVAVVVVVAVGGRGTSGANRACLSPRDANPSGGRCKALVSPPACPRDLLAPEWTAVSEEEEEEGGEGGG